MRNILKDAQVKFAVSKDKSYRFDGKSRIFTIGKYPAITLKDARERHLTAEQLVSDGICPCENKQIQKLKQKQELKALKQANKIAVRHNFEAVAREWYKDTKHEWKNEKHIAAVLSTLEIYVFL